MHIHVKLKYYMRTTHHWVQSTTYNYNKKNLLEED